MARISNLGYFSALHGIFQFLSECVCRYRPFFTLLSVPIDTMYIGIFDIHLVDIRPFQTLHDILRE